MLLMLGLLQVCLKNWVPYLVFYVFTNNINQQQVFYVSVVPKGSTKERPEPVLLSSLSRITPRKTS